MTPAEKRYRYIILGAGAAGLSLCLHLLECGIRDPILILDRKTAFNDDRTWCFWNIRPNPLADLAAHCWHRWEVVDAAGRAALQASPSVGYACVRGLDFYRYAQAEIARHKNVTLALNCPVESSESFPKHVVIRADRDAYAADYVFDSRPRVRPDDGSLSFTQRFFGQFVRTDSPVFDSSRCTLMDFRTSQERGLHFLYLLPFSPTEALIENTYIHDSRAATIPPEQHRTEIGLYLAEQRGLTCYSITQEETGAIPMTTQPLPKRDGRLFFIGTAGGCTKPSSGYTFLRIQEQCRQIAVAAKQESLDVFHERLTPARYRFFDTVFLQVLRDQPAAFPGYFYRLFDRVSPEALTAFLSETSTWRSDLQIMGSLPLSPFVQATLTSLPLWSGFRQSHIFGHG